MAEIERAMDGDDIVAVSIVGEFDLADEARMDLAVDFVVGLQIPNVLIDLSRCEFVPGAVSVPRVSRVSSADWSSTNAWPVRIMWTAQS